MNSFVLKGNVCHSGRDGKIEAHPNSYLVCLDGICKGIFAQLPEEYANLPLTDWGDRLLIPGMSDLHIHAPQFSFRGLGMDMELLDWLNTYTFPEESKYADLSYADRAYGQFAGALSKSFTTRGDLRHHSRPCHHPPHGEVRGQRRGHLCRQGQHGSQQPGLSP